MKLNTKICTFLAVFGATIFAGCNSNPVVVSGGTDSTLLFTQDGRADEASGVDILWVIDNSGSMGEEQATLFANFKFLAKRLAAANIDYQIAVTTTDTKFQKSGSLNNAPQTQLGAAAVVPPKVIFRMVQQAIDCMKDADKAGYQAEVVAKLNAEVPAADQITDYKELTDDKFVSMLEAGAAKVNKSVKDYANTILPQLNDTRFKKLKNYLSSADYIKTDGTVDEDNLTADFSCLAYVGTAGWGIEKGIDSTIQALDPDKYKKGGANEGFIRNKSKFAFVIISDENDCSSEDIEYQGKTLSLNGDKENQCNARVCDLFSTEGIPPEINPLLTPQVAHQKIVENLRAIKGDPEFGEKSVVAAAVTGRVAKVVAGDGENDKDKLPKTTKAPITDINYLLKYVDTSVSPSNDFKSFCGDLPFIDPVSPQDIAKSAELAATCSSPDLGQAASGDRYQELVETFTNYYPKPAADGKAPGELCSANFQGTLEAIANLLTSQASTCISRVLAPCGEGVALGDPCGPADLGGTCVAMPNTNNEGLYCSSAIEVKLIEPTNESDEKLVNSGLCVGDITSHKKYKYSCTLDPKQYTLNECAPDAKGVRFRFADQNITDKLGALKVEVNYVAFPREYDSENDTTN